MVRTSLFHGEDTGSIPAGDKKKSSFMFLFILSSIAKILGLVVPLLVAVAYLTLAERKVMASMQRRKGPNVVGFF